MLEKDDSWEVVDYGPGSISLIKEILLDVIAEESSFVDNKADESSAVHMIYDFPVTWDGEDVSAVAVSSNSSLIFAVEQLVSHLEGVYEGTRARVLIGKLYGNKESYRYDYVNRYHQSVRRIHIPIITNDNVFFDSGATKINMKESFLYEVNNSKPCTLINGSDLDRYHLVIDILPNSQK